MKQYLLAGVVVGAVPAVMTGSVIAADMPVMRESTVIPVPVYSWSGFYVGAHGGGGFGDVDFRHAAFDIGGHTMGGGLFGGHIGYNWQMSPDWLIGVEASGTWSGVKKTIFGPLNIRDFPGSQDDRWTTEVKWLATVTPRIGMTISSWMWYLRGGVAFAQIDHSFESPVGPQSFETSDTKVGWTVGFGGELLLASNWVFGVEGNLYVFGSVSANNTAITNFPDHNIDVSMWSILGRVSYKFGGPSNAVAARY
jgi:outer membrane immunogenic protein